MARSKIEWTEETWNPVTGCSKISAGCKNCYAERMARRLQAMGQPHYRNGFKVTCHEDSLEKPVTWKKPRVVFVNSMSDLFHRNVPLSFIVDIFEVMNECPHHHFQVLTKRAERLAELSPMLPWGSNIWIGVTVESSDYKERIDILREVDADIRFLSLEPLLSSMKELNLSGIDWVIVGGESGPGARAIKKDWVRDIRDQCLNQEVPFFFKQWGGFNKKKNGRMLDGRTWDGMPNSADVF